MLTIYGLKADRDFIRQVQETTQTTDKWGPQPTPKSKSLSVIPSKNEQNLF